MAINLLRKYKSNYGSTSNSFSTGSGVTITPASKTDLPTDTEITLTFDRVDGAGKSLGTKVERIIGVISGDNFVTRPSPSGRGKDGTTEQVHTSPVVEMVWNAKDWNDMIDWGLVQHDQAGLHTDIAWMLANETWAYASASTITVPSGAAAKYAVGDRIKWTQTTVKYGVIVAVADTLLTIAVNTNYVVANAAITLNYYSHEASPIGFPRNIAESGARVYSSTTQTITNTWTKLAYNVEAFDIAGEYNTSAYRFTATRAGLYSITNSTAITSSGKIHIGIYINGTLQAQRILSVSQYENAIITTVWNLAVGGYVEFYAQNDAVGNLTVQNDSAYTFGSIAKVG